MLRLVLKKKDNSKKLTITTDGFDSLMNVFITENPKGDVSDFEKLGLQLKCGHTINVGKLKEFAVNNSMMLISFPEGFEEEGKILQDIIEYEYTLIVNPINLSFAAEGEKKTFEVTSKKQKKINGISSGDSIDQPFILAIEGEGFSKNDSEKSITAEVNAGSERTGKLIVTQAESNKTAEIILTQAEIN